MGAGYNCLGAREVNIFKGRFTQNNKFEQYFGMIYCNDKFELDVNIYNLRFVVQFSVVIQFQIEVKMNGTLF